MVVFHVSTFILQLHVAGGLDLFAIGDGISAKQEGNTPKTCQTDDCIHDAAEQGTLPAKEPCHQVKLENSHKAPVQTADDGKNQCQRVHNFTSVLTLDRDIIPNSERNIQMKQIPIAKRMIFSYNKQKSIKDE